MWNTEKFTIKRRENPVRSDDAQKKSIIICHKRTPLQLRQDIVGSARERAEKRLQGKAPNTDIAKAETALLRALARIQVLK